MIRNSDVVAGVTAALLEDTRTSESAIEVIHDQGVVTLTGIVNSEEVRQAAEQVAHKQQGVISVVNDLEVDARTWDSDTIPPASLGQ
jgi:osmotically-inducible protein OsmY